MIIAFKLPTRCHLGFFDVIALSLLGTLRYDNEDVDVDAPRRQRW